MRAPAALASLGAGPPPQHSSGHYGGASLDTERHADLTDFLRHLHSSALTLLPECNRCRRIRLKTNVDLDRRSVADSPLEEDGFGLAVPPRRERLWAATPGKHCRFGPEPVSGYAFRVAVSDWRRPEGPFAGAVPIDAMGRAAEEMATSSLHLTMECRDAPAERPEQIPRRL
jgi:hypothetical protein